MATLTLNPSGYTGSTNITTSSSYPISNGYDGVDSTTYARLSLSTSSTGYLYYTFDTSNIPSTATIQSVTAKARVRVSSTSRVTSTVCQLYSGTTAKGSNTTFASTSSTNVVTLTCGTWSLSELSDLRMRIGGTGSSSSQSKYIYFYGAEVVITYVTEPRTITVTLSGNGTVSPSGSNTYYDADEIEVIITPTNKSDTVTATRDGVDITNQLVAHGTEIDTSRVLGAYTLVSGSFNSGESWFEGREGNGHDTSDTTTSNYYSGSSSSTAVFTYDVGFDLPSNANITRVYAIINAHAESSSNSSEYMCFQLISGSTELSEEINFKEISTSNTDYTLECDTLPTVSQIASMKLQCQLGYYGGALNGATVYVEYDTGGGTVDHYTYTFTVSADTTIAVVIGGAVVQDVMLTKVGSTYKTVITGYKKISGVWTAQSDVADLYNYLNTHSVKKG